MSIRWAPLLYLNEDVVHRCLPVTTGAHVDRDPIGCGAAAKPFVPIPGVGPGTRCYLPPDRQSQQVVLAVENFLYRRRPYRKRCRGRGAKQVVRADSITAVDAFGS